jgi:hypothetical protein
MDRMGLEGDRPLWPQTHFMEGVGILFTSIGFVLWLGLMLIGASASLVLGGDDEQCLSAAITRYRRRQMH